MGMTTSSPVWADQYSAVEQLERGSGVGERDRRVFAGVERVGEAQELSLPLLGLIDPPGERRVDGRRRFGRVGRDGPRLGG